MSIWKEKEWFFPYSPNLKHIENVWDKWLKKLNRKDTKKAEFIGWSWNVVEQNYT